MEQCSKDIMLMASPRGLAGMRGLMASFTKESG
jgi:hypothetical protein